MLNSLNFPARQIFLIYSIPIMEIQLEIEPESPLLVRPARYEAIPD